MRARRVIPEPGSSSGLRALHGPLFSMRIRLTRSVPSHERIATNSPEAATRLTTPPHCITTSTSSDRVHVLVNALEANPLYTYSSVSDSFCFPSTESLLDSVVTSTSSFLNPAIASSNLNLVSVSLTRL